MPSDAVVYALVAYAWLTWFTAQQRKLIRLGGPRQAKHAANKMSQGKQGHDGGLIVLQWGAAHNDRIERQLRGRAGRQGDPGETHVIISMEDPTMYAMHESLILQEQLLDRRASVLLVHDDALRVVCVNLVFFLCTLATTGLRPEAWSVESTVLLLYFKDCLVIS
jgi:hypothetical protein